jgi:hypothetical protein
MKEDNGTRCDSRTTVLRYIVAYLSVCKKNGYDHERIGGSNATWRGEYRK